MTYFLTRTALILASASALAACGTMPEAARPNYPTRVEVPPMRPAPPPPPTVTAEPEPEARPLPPVQTQALPPISAPPPRASAPPPPPPAPPPRPATQQVSRTTVAGRVVDAEGPAASYTVKRGDNLDAIARTMGTTRQKLAEDNNLKSPYALRPGQVLKGAAVDSKAYVVGQGDTLFAIARRFNVTAAAIAEANNMEVGASLASGRRLILPQGYRDRGPTVTQVAVPVSGGGSFSPPPSRPEPQAPSSWSAPPASEPVAESVTRTRVTGRVVDTTGPAQSYTVKNGDNLDGIARSMGTTRKQLADDNKLKEPYRLKLGQVLKGPPTTAKAYVVGEDDTLALIARRFGVTQRALAGANDMRVGASIRAGRRLTLPSGYRDRGPIREQVTPERPPQPVVTTPQPVPPPPPVRPTPTYPSAVQAPPPVVRPTPIPITPPQSSSGGTSDAQLSALGRGRFNWPIRGDVVADFGPKGTGQRNDGINIRAVADEPVRASAAGDVVYAGDQVPGFGNLVLIKHADGWVTAYGHLGRVDVKMQQKIAQGQQIGQAGSTGGVSEPQLHFEVRYAPTPQDRARPIDPKLVLPR